MFTVRKLLFFAVFLIFMSHISYAQEVVRVDEQPITEAQISTLKKWVSDYSKYIIWYQKWGNTIHPPVVRDYPEVPLWLWSECEDLIGGEGIIVDACNLLKSAENGYIEEAIKQSIILQRKKLENSSRTKFYEKVHFGGGWPVMMSAQSFKYFAVFETHLTIAGLDKVEINLPGLIIVNVPDELGNRTLKIGTDITVGFKIGEFKVPGYNRFCQLHLNLANAFIYNTISRGFGSRNRMSLIGLSVTLKKD